MKRYLKKRRQNKRKKQTKFVIKTCLKFFPSGCIFKIMRRQRFHSDDLCTLRIRVDVFVRDTRIGKGVGGWVDGWGVRRSQKGNKSQHF